MAVYNSKTLKEKSAGGKFNVRRLELPDKVWKKLWIPDDSFLYHRIHYKVKTLTPYKNAKYDICDCFNQVPGEGGKGCPICDHINSLWAKWREADKAKDDTEKKKLQNIINQILGEEYYVNGIDIEDEDLKFQAVRLTRPKFKELTAIGEAHGYKSVLFRYRKEVGTPTKYTLVEDDNEAVVKKLNEKFEELMGRDYDMGGPVDLDKLLRNFKNKDAYMAILEGDDAEDSGDEGTTEHSAPASSKKKEPDVDVGDEAISMDELGMGDDKPKDPPKKEEPKKETKKADPVKPKDEEISLDSLDLEPLELDGDLKLDDEPKLIELTYAQFVAKTKEKDYAFCEMIADKLIADKLITPAKMERNPKILSAAEYIKSKTTIKYKE